jgi:hypothetical protein
MAGFVTRKDLELRFPVKDVCDLAVKLNATLPEGEEKALAIEKLEEVQYFISIAE